MFTLQGQKSLQEKYCGLASKPWNPECHACQYYKSKETYHAKRARLKRLGSLDELPSFNLPVIKADKNCSACRKRCDYNRRKVARSKNKKLARQHMMY